MIVKNSVHAIAVAVVTVIALAGGAAADIPPSRPMASEVNADVTGLRSDGGVVRCAAWTTANGKDFALHYHRAVVAPPVPIKEKKARALWVSLPEGTYAAFCFHDENGNGKLDGKEGHSPSKFFDAKFEVVGLPQVITLALRYP